jgi:DHA2 family multidrug resistance protein
MASTDSEVPSVNRWPTAICATLGTWSYSFTWNTVSVALPDMKGAFSATNDQIAWVMIAFIVGSAAMTASIGWLSSRFGRKQLFLFAIAGFTISLIGCGSATTIEEEVVWRFFQGVSGAPLIALGQIITVNSFPPDRYSMATSFWALGFVSGNVIAPYAGGLLIDQYDWPWVFYINLPICIGVFIAGIVLIPNTAKTPRKLDWFGLLTLVVGVSLLQVMLARGERLDWFDSNEIILTSAFAITLIYLFVTHTVIGRDTFIDRSLFRDFNFSLGQVVIFVVGGAIYMPLLLLPLMLAQIGGYPPLEVGSLLFARGIGSVISLIILSQIRDRMDPRPLIVLGLLLNIIPAWEMAHWSPEILPWDVQWTNFLSGVGTSCIWAPLNRMVLARLKGKYQDQGFAMFYLNFDIGYAIGTSLIIGLYTRFLQINHALLSENITPFNEMLRYPSVVNAWSIHEMDGLAGLQSEVARQAAMIAYNNSFMACAIAMIILLPVVYLFNDNWSEKKKLRAD